VTEEETTLIDYVQSWGALILGHAHPAVVEAIQRQATFGTSYGACHALEVELAEKIKHSFPSIEKLRFVNSGTEAGMSAIRLARGATGRERIVKFEGCYHGHADSLLVKAGSGGATFGVPDSAGIPAELAKQTLTLPFNDIQKVEELFAEMGDQIASIIVEPIPANMGVVLPDPAFLAKLREVTQQSGSVLIFDEVVSGFRVGLGGGGAGALQCSTRFNDIGENYWRGASCWGIWRKSILDGSALSSGEGLPGWNLIRESAGDGSRMCDIRRDPKDWFLYSA